MNRVLKRIVLLGVVVGVGVAIVATTGGFRSGLPAANPAAAKAAPAAPEAAAPSSPQASNEEAERWAQLQRKLAENPRDAAALGEVVDALFRAKRYAQAADFLEDAIEAGAESSRLRVGLGLAFFYQGMPGKAQRELRKAIELDPNNVDAHFNYALMMSHGQRADMNQARASWEKVVQLDPDGDLGRKARDFLAQTGPKDAPPRGQEPAAQGRAPKGQE